MYSSSTSALPTPASLKNKKILLTAGPTYEPIDPVRFIGNHSTGKMGYALAEAFARAGGQVILVSGPTTQKAEHPAIQVIPVTTADQMYAQVKQHADDADILVFAAAVADYKPKEVSTVKVKKKEETLTLELVKNVDIAKTIGQTKKPGQFTVGFALETDNEVENARAKLQTKNLDLIVLNSLQDVGAGFKHDTNKITIIQKDKITIFDLKPKTQVAADIVNFISERIHV
ncbi:bifunctional phosphopantothenoylcysteine decarboxylase/phosphopantothenate--cysteine ligase CoaBC [Adhaeribacter rhizoryzae]|uniref:bifunctional phosphopantothenoylcysteine decarboxylase/phosphopantothenate--cysteine ligase CoaBC n=1 Tax=Adhaeribacter rhizoryzae TaxID=2607907 RepID=UPI00167FDF38|nr:bifunctional phosphopantothenoylcysteine decarboxylase/phosphopantothenate--cysteine ligase CoaBC [Adhaeribacter rhizoryzae]